MPDDVKNALLMTYANEILELVDYRDEMTRSDLQGAIEAVIRNLLNGNHNAKLEKIVRSGA